MSQGRGPIPEDIIDEIAARTDIVEVISRYVPLKRAGASYSGLCPFHNEKSPSFSVSPSKGFFHCFGCGAGGTVFTFLMRMEGISFPEAVRLLAKETGVTIPERELSPEDRARAQTRERYRRINEMAAHFYERALAAAPGEAARAYLDRRGIDEATRTRFRLGACVEGWDHLSTWLTKKGVAKRDLIALGLSAERRDGGLYDRFRDRLMFPICNEKGEVIGFGGRILEADKAPQKYINTAETPAFHKSRSLYGIDKARKAIREAGLVLVVEGYMDVLACHQAGQENVVAPLGTALTEEQVKALLRHAYRITLSFDGDAAGRRAAMRSIELVERLGGTARVLELPDGQDPDEYIRAHGIEAFRERLAHATPALVFQLAYLSEGADLRLIEERLRILDEVLPTLWHKNKAADRAEAFTQIAEALDMTEQTVREEWDHFRRYGRGKAPREVAEAPETVPKEVLPERSALLLAYCFGDSSLIDEIEAVEGASVFDIRARGLYEHMRDCRQSGRPFGMNDVPEAALPDFTSALARLEAEGGIDRATFERVLLEQRYDYVAALYQQMIEKLSRLDGSDASQEQSMLEHLETLLSRKTALEHALGKEL